MKILILGGSKSGKSSYAERTALRLAKEGKRYYIATMIPFDEEDQKRIENHRNARNGKGFETIEMGRSIHKCLELPDTDPDAVFLVDSITALLLNEWFPDTHSQNADFSGTGRCLESLQNLASSTRDIVLVSDYIFSDAARYDEFTESYRAALASLHIALAESFDVVIELSAGNIICHKGELIP